MQLTLGRIFSEFGSVKGSSLIRSRARRRAPIFSSEPVRPGEAGAGARRGARRGAGRRARRGASGRPRPGGDDFFAIP